MKTLLLVLLLGLVLELSPLYSGEDIEIRIQEGALHHTSEKNITSFVDYIKKCAEHFEIEATIIVVIRSEDLEDSPVAQIFKLPKVFTEQESFVIHVNPSVLNQPILAEHVAYHEYCHIVVWEKMEDLPKQVVEFIDDEELRVERQVYFFVGSKRYLEFLVKGGFIPDTGEKIDAEKYIEILQQIFEKTN